MPPPGRSTGGAASERARPRDRTSGVQSAGPRMPAATVDEVTADLSKDPRREQDDDEDEG
jgi:hypothetical protein